MSRDIERQLAELRNDVKKLLERAETPRLMKYERAARMLDISTSKLKSLIRQGIITPQPLGQTRMIPLSEVERVSKLAPGSVPKGHRRRSLFGPKARDFDAAKELAKVKRR